MKLNFSSKISILTNIGRDVYNIYKETFTLAKSPESKTAPKSCCIKGVLFARFDPFSILTCVQVSSNAFTKFEIDSFIFTVRKVTKDRWTSLNRCRICCWSYISFLKFSSAVCYKRFAKINTPPLLRWYV